MPKLTDPGEWGIIKDVYFTEDQPKSEEADRVLKRIKKQTNQAR